MQLFSALWPAKDTDKVSSHSGDFKVCAHLSVLLQTSFVQASAVFCTTCALVRYRGIHIPNAPVAKDTAADAREENT